MQPWGIQQAMPQEHTYRYTLRSPRVLASTLIAYPIALATLSAINWLLPPHQVVPQGTVDAGSDGKRGVRLSCDAPCARHPRRSPC